MSEMQKYWEKAMYENEIEEAKGSIANERIWAHGASNEEEEIMHLENIRELEEYIEHLNNLIDELGLGDE